MMTLLSATKRGVKSVRWCADPAEKYGWMLIGQPQSPEQKKPQKDRKTVLHLSSLQGEGYADKTQHRGCEWRKKRLFTNENKQTLKGKSSFLICMADSVSRVSLDAPVKLTIQMTRADVHNSGETSFTKHTSSPLVRNSLEDLILSQTCPSVEKSTH